MSIKRLSPEAIETFTMVLHPKRVYSARRVQVEEASGAAIATEGGAALLTEDGEILSLES